VSNKPNNLVLTNSEYEDIVQRLVDSMPVLEQIKMASHRSESFQDFQKEVDKKCEKLTLRAKIISFVEQKESLI
jgi:AmiR/NasT family two-component response regulator